MNTESDRRAHGATRIPFEGLVEVAGAVGPSFEAQAIDVSEEGIHLRTAYLPELGQRISCRFDAGPNATVLASGAVVWRREHGRAGEFGVRFENIDQESLDALHRLMTPSGSIKAEEPPFEVEPGARVRLHIEGLASPMRAKVRDFTSRDLTVGSELGFLRLGNELDLEDAASGAKRAARIDRIRVEVEPASQVPTLVVGLRYLDGAQESVEAVASVAETSVPADETDPDIQVHVDEDEYPSGKPDFDAVKQASQDVGRAFAKTAAGIGPALQQLAKRAKITVTLLAGKVPVSAPKDETMAVKPRRVTAAAPSGGLHATGRRVVRGEPTPPMPASEFEFEEPKLDKRKIAMGACVGVLLIAGAVAMRKPAAPPAVGEVSTPSATEVAQVPQNPASPSHESMAPSMPNAQIPAVTAQPLNAAPGAAMPATPAAPSLAAVPTEIDTSAIEEESAPRPRRKSKLAVAAFSNGPVNHGNVLRLHMDGSIEKILGAPQPTGFTVVLPNRRSLEAAGPLAARDQRIASIRVTNEPGGAELAVSFKDGVPNYQVRAKGDVLEIVLASMAPVETVAAPPPPVVQHLPSRQADAVHTHGHGKKRGHGRH